MKSLFSTLNARLIIIHLIAFWFFFYAFQTFAFLHDHTFFNPILERVNRLQFPDRYNFDKTLIQQMGNAGLIVAYVIAWFIASKWNWHWINSVIVFVIAFALGNLNWFGWDTLSVIFLAPGKLFGINTIGSLLTNGVIMLALGLLLLFLKNVNVYINNGDPGQKRKIEADKKARRLK
jgi:hypothetical protein